MSAILKQKLIDIANGFTKYGLWKGGGSSALSDMSDVKFTNLQANDVLKYNGSVWINDDNLQKQIDTLNSNFEKSNMIFKTITVDSKTTTFSLRYSGDVSLRLPVMVFVVGQFGYVGLYSISVFYNSFELKTINGITATITDNGNGTITITFNQSNIWGTGFIIAPKNII